MMMLPLHQNTIRFYYSPFANTQNNQFFENIALHSQQKLHKQIEKIKRNRFGWCECDTEWTVFLLFVFCSSPNCQTAAICVCAQYTNAMRIPLSTVFRLKYACDSRATDVPTGIGQADSDTFV